MRKCTQLVFYLIFCITLSHYTFFPGNIGRCILDGEMLVWDTSSNRFAEFGSNQEIGFLFILFFFFVIKFFLLLSFDSICLAWIGFNIFFFSLFYFTAKAARDGLDSDRQVFFIIFFFYFRKLWSLSPAYAASHPHAVVLYPFGLTLLKVEVQVQVF